MGSHVAIVGNWLGGAWGVTVGAGRGEMVLVLKAKIKYVFVSMMPGMNFHQ